MKNFGKMIKTILSLSTALFYSSAIARTSAFAFEDSLFIKKDGTVSRVYFPHEISRQGNYDIVINQEKEEVEEVKKNIPEKELDLDDLLYRAKKHYNNHQYKNALDLIEKADEISPNNIQVKTMQGSLNYALGRQEMALKHWKVALSIDPENKDLSKVVQNIEARISKQ